ncbi:hypothetical protein [Pseudanabaena galeata]|uniref:hypothetical protein n=1 Tax=Pseudanabaena galeata TaxID=1112103 RepID=UPI00247A089D|nr:hypothetical protein [Pseudanabaena galeata]WGS71736.1 hypothetical protein OA858_18820 [Pseudanabaena galeata CCNP1313]
MNKKSKPKLSIKHIFDVAQTGWEIRYVSERFKIQVFPQHSQTKKICSVESVQSSKPIIPTHDTTPIEIILLWFVLTSPLVRLTLYIFGRKRS